MTNETIIIEEVIEQVTIIVNEELEEVIIQVTEVIEIVTIQISEMGSPGVKGDAGNIAYFEAGEIISGGRLLVLINGKAFKFNATDELHYGKEIGFSVIAVTVGETVPVVKAGKIAIGSLIQDETYYANDDGLIFTTPVFSGIFLAVGTAIDNQILQINITDSILI
jgi:hypothetical protein